MRPIGSRGARGPPGPPPPRSWLSSSVHAPEHLRNLASEWATGSASPDRLARLPDAHFPDNRSLLHLCLKRLAQNWPWHLSYDQYYLALMPVKLKATLLSYIAFYCDDASLDIDGLRTLFLDEDQLDGATGCEDLTHLDLAASLGRSITFRQLDQFFTRAVHPCDPQPSSPAPDTFASEALESWDLAAECAPSPAPAMANTIIPRGLAPSRLPNLTHLSLSHPPSTISWPRLLAFATVHLATLTHLSLAYWPVPSLTPNANSRAATTSNKYTSGSVAYGCSDFYSSDSGDWSEAAGILMRLSRATYCLKWLDLEGCGTWLEALRWEAEDGAGGGGPEWCGGWRGVEVVRAHTGVPVDGRRLRIAGISPSAAEAVRMGNEQVAGSARGLQAYDWDVEEERKKYYEVKTLMALDQLRVEAQTVEAFVRKKRRSAGIGVARITLENEWTDLENRAA